MDRPIIVRITADPDLPPLARPEPHAELPSWWDLLREARRIRRTLRP